MTDCRQRTCVVDRFAINPDFAAVRRLKAGQNLHERRFSSAVLAQDSDDAALAESYADVVVGMDRAEVLVNSANLYFHKG